MHSSIAPPHAAPRRRWGDVVLDASVRAGAACVVLMLAALVGVLLAAAVPSLRTFGTGFLVSSEWRPNELERPARGPDGKVVIEDGEVVTETVPPAFGALPVIYGTAVSSALALLLAVPFSLATALFLVRIAPRMKLVVPVSFLVEFLAAIPSIAIGLWGLFILCPFLQAHVEPGIRSALGGVPFLRWMFFEERGGVEHPIALTGRDMFAGSVLLAVMIVPIITAVSRDVLRAVPRAQIEGSLALGATWWQSCVVMLRYGRTGLFGAVMLGLARAAGETMAITMVIGNNSRVAPSPFSPAQTMSSLLANEFAEASSAIHRAALLEVALILLVMSLLFNVVARALVVGRSRRGES